MVKNIKKMFQFRYMGGLLKLAKGLDPSTSTLIKKYSTFFKVCKV